MAHYLKKELYNLVKSDERIFDFLQQGSMDGLWYWDLKEPENEWMNARFWETLGYNPQEMPHLASAWQDIINQEDLKLAVDNFNKHLADPNHPYDQEVRYTHKNGSVVWVRCRGMAIRDEQGNPTRMLGVHQDITALKNAKQILYQEEQKALDNFEKYKAMYENTPLAFQSLNNDGNIIDVNPQWLKILQYQRDEVIGKWFGDFLHNDCVDYFTKNFSEFKKQGCINNVQFKMKKKNGEFIDVSFEGCVGYNDKEEFRQTYCTFKDITKQKRAEEKLIFLNKSITELLTIDNKKQLFGYFTESIKSVYPETIVLYVSINGKSCISTLESIAGLESSILKHLQKVVSGKIIGRQYALTEKHLEIFRKGQFHNYSGNLADFSDNQFPVAGIKMIQKLLKINQIYTIGINKENGLLGALHLITLNDTEINDGSFLETYTAHFAALVENLNIKTQLQEAKDQYHSLVEATPNIILTHTLDGTITYINENGAELFGLDQTLIVGQNLNALLGEKQSIKFAENMKELLSYKQGERLKKETKIEINSRIKDFELVGTLLYADTEADEVLLYATDITDRKMADDKLKESEEKFRTIFEHSPVMIDAFDKNGKCILWNKECENKLGYTLEEINQSENPITLFYPDANIREAVLKTIIKKPDKRFREWNPITKNGEKLPSLWANFRISDEFIISIGLDISKRKEAEEALLLSEARFKALHNASFGGITIHDKGVILECNKGLSEITGYETEELIGMDGLLLIAEESRDMVMDHITSGYEKPYEAVGIRKNGEKYPLRLEGRQIPYQGKIVRVVEFRDITKQKKIEFALIEAKEKAEESDRLKSAFLSNMSHEIRTPMNGILGFTELLKEPGLSGDEQEKYIEIIRKSGERMLDTVNDIIDISKIDAGQMEVASNNVNIQEESGYLYEFFKGEAFSKGLEMSFTNKLSEGDSFILTDRLKVISIISNLIKNAIKYTDEGTINVFCSRQESQLVVKVSDTGIGISKERVDSIFNRFEQADISDVHAREGSGLGLSISQAYAEMLGGEITVESEPGKGSVFILSLPWTQHHDVVKSTRERMETTTVEDIHTAKILIVEDDDTSFEHLSILVGSVSKYVVRAENGKDAVDFVRNNNVDLILMDIKLPIMTGYEATKEIRKFNMDVIIIAQTAYALSGERDTALAAGCNDYISKPIDKNQLLKLMKKYL